MDIVSCVRIFKPFGWNLVKKAVVTNPRYCHFRKNPLLLRLETKKDFAQNEAFWKSSLGLCHLGCVLGLRWRPVRLFEKHLQTFRPRWRTLRRNFRRRWQVHRRRYTVTTGHRKGRTFPSRLRPRHKRRHRQTLLPRRPPLPKPTQPTR